MPLFLCLWIFESQIFGRTSARSCAYYMRCQSHSTNSTIYRSQYDAVTSSIFSDWSDCQHLFNCIVQRMAQCKCMSL